jgi:hypothetical protein
MMLRIATFSRMTLNIPIRKCGPKRDNIRSRAEHCKCQQNDTRHDNMKMRP